MTRADHPQGVGAPPTGDEQVPTSSPTTTSVHPDIVDAIERMQAILLQPNAKGLFSNDFVMCVARAAVALATVPTLAQQPTAGEKP